jgi:hypothetical protein
MKLLLRTQMELFASLARPPELVSSERQKAITLLRVSSRAASSIVRETRGFLRLRPRSHRQADLSRERERGANGDVRDLIGRNIAKRAKDAYPSRHPPNRLLVEKC